MEALVCHCSSGVAWCTSAANWMTLHKCLTIHW